MIDRRTTAEKIEEARDAIANHERALAQHEAALPRLRARQEETRQLLDAALEELSDAGAAMRRQQGGQGTVLYAPGGFPVHDLEQDGRAAAAFEEAHQAYIVVGEEDQMARIALNKANLAVGNLRSRLALWQDRLEQLTDLDGREQRARAADERRRQGIIGRLAARVGLAG